MSQCMHPDLPGIHGNNAFTLDGVITAVDAAYHIGMERDGYVATVVGDGHGAKVQIIEADDGTCAGIEVISGGWGYTHAYVDIEHVDGDGSDQLNVEIGSIQYPAVWWRTVSAQEIEALGFVEYVPPEPEPPTPEQVIEAFRLAIQSHIDAQAISRRYDNGNSLAGYVNSTVPQWAAEAIAFVAWRDAVWLYAHEEMDKVLDGARGQPTIEAFLAELPELVWPA